MRTKLHLETHSFKSSDKKFRKLFGRGPLKELKGFASTLGKDKDAEELAEYYLTEIAASQRRTRKMTAEINRLGKKIQAILDKLP